MFTDKLNVMLYVNDVKESSLFWQSIGFVEKSAQEMEGTMVVEIAPTQTSPIAFTLYEKAFIEKMSPEIDVDSTPSVLFEVEEIDTLNKKMKELSIVTGEVQDMGDVKVFNFADLDGNYFAVSGK
ncbi:MAG: VOC family protein [Streptococcaceae bacterium]|jgi:predicted lactoylglutathione lyase|nr:VOC family protein [Streptococcaceae bacterium]